MHTVLRVDLKALAAVFIVYNFIDAGRTITLCWLSVFRQVYVNRNAGVLQVQMAWLIFFVVGVGQKHGTQFIEADFAIGFGVTDRRVIRCRLGSSVVRRHIVEIDRQFAIKYVLINIVECCANPGAEFMHCSTKITTTE